MMGGGVLYNRLKVLFKNANEKFNAGLFAPDEYLDNLNIQDKTISKIINQLYYPECQYEFSVLPVEILGSIYERFLGKIIRFTRKTKTGHSITIEEKPEVQKAGGVFYTPDYIVRYIVAQTIGKKIEGKTPDQVAKMRFVDPACGSGSFLVGAFQYLLDWHLDYYENSANLAKAEKANKIYKDAATHTYKLSVEEKRRILLNNIYGVDIDAQAVEVTKLSLFLKLLENEGKALKGDAADLFRASEITQGKILPDMRGNIKCGNSLIGSDYYAGRFDFDLAEQRKVNAFDWEFGEVSHGFGPTNADAFKFDCVIGNPPYVSVELMSDSDKEYYRSHFACFFKRADLFSLFVEKSLVKISKGDALISFIMPSVVHTNLSYKKLRDLFLDKNWLKEVCYTGGKVFSGATIDTTILVFDKNGNENIALKNALDFENKTEHIVPKDYFEKFKNVISIGEGENDSIIEKFFNENFQTLAENFTVFQGIVTGNNPAFIFETEEEALSKGIEKELLHPLCHGRDIGKYEVRSAERRILYVDENVVLNDYPNAKKWLLQFKAGLDKRNKDKNDKIAWNHLHRPRVKAELDIKEKIVVQGTRNESLKTRIVATLDASGVYGSQGVNFIIPKNDSANLRALLAILNSKLVNYLFATKFLNLAIKAEYLKQIKIPDLTKFKEAPLGDSNPCDNLKTLCDQMLATKAQLAGKLSDADKKLLEQRCEILDKNINTIVYQLYGLTDEEVKMVEGK